MYSNSATASSLSETKRFIALLYGSRLLTQTAFGMVSIFLPVFFFVEFGMSLYAMLITFLATYLLSSLLAPVGARFFHLLSMRAMMLASIPFALLGMLALAFAEHNLLLAVFIHIIAISIYKGFYWVPYHVDMSLLLEQGSRGRRLAFLYNLSEVVAITTPLIAGLVIATLGFSTAFLFSSAFFLLSMLPLFFIPPIYERYSFSFLQTFRELFRKRNRRLFFGYASDGAQTAVGALVWPVFIFLILDESYTAAGAVTALTIAFLMIVRIVAGNYIDRKSREGVLNIGAWLVATGWLLKAFIETGLQIFLFDVYHRAGKAVSKVSLDASSYEFAADNGHYIDEFTVLREIAIALGRAALIIIAMVLTAFLPMQAVFLVAALLTLGITFLAKGNIHVSA